VFWTPDALAARLQALGFATRIEQTSRYFIYGDVRERPAG